MYLNLKKALAGKDITVKNYALILGVSESTASNKLFGRTDFTLDEVNKTLELFPEYTLKYLFATNAEE